MESYKNCQPINIIKPDMSEWGLTVLLIIVLYTFSNPLVFTTEYTVETYSWNSTDENILSTELRPIRIGPGVYGMNGTFHLGTDFDGHKYEMEILFGRSNFGTSQYVNLPFHVRKTSLYTIMNTVYKKYAMKDLSQCAGLPSFEGEWTGPLKANDFFVNMCILDSKTMPQNLPSGFYRVMFIANGPTVKFVATVIAKVN